MSSKTLPQILILLVLAVAPLGCTAQQDDAKSVNAKVVSALQAGRNPFPSGWRVVIVAESAWSPLWKSNRIRSETAFTDLTNKTTYLRETYVRSATELRIRHTLLHEAGHVACQCADEDAAERFASIH